MSTPISDQQLADIDVAVQALAKAGVSMSTNVRHIFGGMEITVHPEDVPVLLRSRERFIERKLKVSYADYELWLERGGYVPCSGRTKSGAPCRGHSPGRADEPEEFAARCRAGELCVAHA
jgi:hypothetical protein